LKDKYFVDVLDERDKIFCLCIGHNRSILLNLWQADQLLCLRRRLESLTVDMLNVSSVCDILPRYILLIYLTN